MSCDTPQPDTDAVSAIARTEHWRGMLEDLAEVGMALAKDIAQRSMEAPYHPELKHDPGRSFAGAARAVRLSIILAIKADEHIFALRNGGASTFLPSVKAIASAAPVEIGPRPDRPPTVGVRERVWETIDHEIGDREDVNLPREHAREHLIEREDDDDLLAGDVDTCVAAIRADLGLQPETLPRAIDLVDIDVEPHRRQ